MDIIKTMKPGSPGTKRYASKWNDKLVAIRYRKDPKNKRIVTTAELIVDERPLNYSALFDKVLTNHDAQIVYVRVEYREKHLQNIIRREGGQWVPRLGAWALPYRDVKLLELTDRIL